MSKDIDIADMSDEDLMQTDDTEFIPADDNEYDEVINEGNDEGNDEKPSPQEEDSPQEESTPPEEATAPDEQEATEATEPETQELDKGVLAPLRANGRDIEINSVEELRQLASMGANYNKKMQEMKPNMKIMRTLQAQNLLNEESINHIIALKQGDKTAIAQLLKDSDIDLSYDELPQATDDYQANDFTISDAELALDDVIEELKSSEHYSATMDILGNKWDAASQSIVAENPASMRTVHDHVASGLYTQIWGEVERQRMLGNLTTQSDVEAYDAVGNAMQEQGMFDTEPKESSAQKQKRANARNGAASSPNRSGGRKSPKKEMSATDIMSMTDAEIEKITIPGLF